jgi:hypothetical protein
VRAVLERVVWGGMGMGMGEVRCPLLTWRRISVSETYGRGKGGTYIALSKNRITPPIKKNPPADR